eukprot:974678-Prymnesium_polylepis.1
MAVVAVVARAAVAAAVAGRAAGSRRAARPPRQRAWRRHRASRSGVLDGLGAGGVLGHDDELARRGGLAQQVDRQLLSQLSPRGAQRRHGALGGHVLGQHHSGGDQGDRWHPRHVRRVNLTVGAAHTEQVREVRAEEAALERVERGAYGEIGVQHRRDQRRARWALHLVHYLRVLCKLLLRGVHLSGVRRLLLRRGEALLRSLVSGGGALVDERDEAGAA